MRASTIQYPDQSNAKQKLDKLQQIRTKLGGVREPGECCRRIADGLGRTLLSTLYECPVENGGLASAPPQPSFPSIDFQASTVAAREAHRLFQTLVVNCGLSYPECSSSCWSARCRNSANYPTPSFNPYLRHRYDKLASLSPPLLLPTPKLIHESPSQHQEVVRVILPRFLFANHWNTATGAILAPFPAIDVSYGRNMLWPEATVL